MTRVAAGEALRALASEELWGEFFDSCPRTPETVEQLTPRFRAALRAYGEYSEPEVRRAVADRLGVEDDAPDSSAEPVNDRRAETVAPGDNVVRFPAAKNPGGEDAGGGRADTGDPRAASRALHRLYADGARLEIRDGELYAGRSGGLTEEDRTLLRQHKEGLKSLLSKEAMREVWSPTLRYMARALGNELEGVRYERAVELYDEAQEAYQDGDNGLCRYLLQRAALAAQERLSGAPERPERSGVDEGDADEG